MELRTTGDGLGAHDERRTRRTLMPGTRDVVVSSVVPATAV